MYDFWSMHEGMVAITSFSKGHTSLISSKRVNLQTDSQTWDKNELQQAHAATQVMIEKWLKKILVQIILMRTLNSSKQTYSPPKSHSGQILAVCSLNKGNSHVYHKHIPLVTQQA